MLQALGVISGIILVIGDIPYMINTLKGRTKPHRTTWGIIFLLNVITLANQIALGATASLGLVIGAVFAVGTIFALSLKYGTGGLEPLDVGVLAGAGIGLLLWWFFNTPLASVVINVFISLVALIPTFKKAWLDPASETHTTWLIGSIAAGVAALSVGGINALLIVPIYSALSQLSVYIILQSRKPNNAYLKHQIGPSQSLK